MQHRFAKLIHSYLAERGRIPQFQPTLQGLNLKRVFVWFSMLFSCRSLALGSFITILLCVVTPPRAQATYFDLNWFYFQDQFQTPTPSTLTRTLYDISAGALMGRSENWIWAVNYGGGSFSDKGSVETTFSFTDMGLKIGYFWSKQRSWFTTLTYNINSKAKYNDGTDEVELRGTSLKMDVGYLFWPTDSLGLAAKVVVYRPTYTESLSEGALTDVNYPRQLIYPSLSFVLSY